MWIALHVDGLLLRFGRAAPEAVAMLSSLVRLRRGLARSPQGNRLEIVPVRFARRPELHQAGDLFEELARAGLAAFFDPGPHGARVLPEPADLRAPPDGLPADHAQTVLFSGNMRDVAAAQAAGVVAYHVRQAGSMDEKWVTCADIPRRVEEMLRVPTARPMRASVRTGALLSMSLPDVEKAPALGIEAMQADPTSEWLVLGEAFLLYTEEPDFEDQLVDQGRYHRISFGVHKDALVIERGLERDEGCLFQSAGFTLVESPQSRNQASPTRDTQAVPWDAARFRIFRDEPDPATRCPAPDGSALLSELCTWSDAFAGLRGENRPALKLCSRLEATIGSAAAPDLLAHSEKPLAVTWFGEPGESVARRVAALLYELPKQPDGTVEPGALAFATALALTIQHKLLVSVPGAALFQVLRFDEVLSVEALLQSKLLASELAALSMTIEIGLSSDSRQASTGLVIGCSGEIQPKLEKARSVATKVAIAPPGRLELIPKVRIGVINTATPAPDVLHDLLSLLTAALSE